MAKRIAYFEYGRVFPRPNVDAAPLTNDNPPADLEPDAPHASPRGWAVIAVLWYICHAAIVGGAYVTTIVDAEGYCTSPLQPVVAIPAALALWAVTLFVRHQARGGNR
jgi:hypothetical protein